MTKKSKPTPQEIQERKEAEQRERDWVESTPSFQKGVKALDDWFAK